MVSDEYYTCAYMTPLRQTAFRIPDELLDAMQRVKDEKGVPFSTQVRFALREWLKANGVHIEKSERKRAVTRKRRQGV